jgi:hypothetical protein
MSDLIQTQAFQQTPLTVPNINENKIENPYHIGILLKQVSERLIIEKIFLQYQDLHIISDKDAKECDILFVLYPVRFPTPSYIVYDKHPWLRLGMNKKNILGSFNFVWCNPHDINHNIVHVFLIVTDDAHLTISSVYWGQLVNEDLHYLDNKIMQENLSKI